jgi:O-antigen/teichoic acid export membrane protein
MRSGKTALLHFVSQVARSVAGFLATFFIARYLGAAPLGKYTLTLTLLFWLKFPTDSIKPAISKRMSEANSSEGVFSTGILLAFIYTGAVAVLLFFARDSVNTYLGAELSLLLASLLFANATFDAIVGGLIGVRRVAASGWLGTAERMFRLLCQIGFVIGGLALIGLVLGYLVSLIAVSLLGVYMLRDHLHIPTRESFKSLRSFAQYSWLGSLRGSALNWMDILVLGFFVVDSLIGIYQVTWTLASFLAITGTSIATTLFPEISALNARNEPSEIKHLLDEGLVFVGIFLIPGFFGALVVGDNLLRIYRPEFAQGSIILSILIAARCINVYGEQFVNTLNGVDKPEVAFRINAVFLVANLGLNVGLVTMFGWYGAAIATLASSGVYLILGYWYLRQELGTLSIPHWEIGLEIAASLVMLGFVHLLLQQLSTSHISTIGAITAGAAVYGILLLSVSTRIREKAFSFV